MCTLSPRLKLCTCGAPNVSRLTHYWVLYRFNAKKDNRVIGRVVMPDAIDPRAEAHNRAMLRKRLNDGDAFDVELAPQIGDRLQLTFRCSEPDASGKARDKTVTYGYALTASGWVEEAFDPLSWRWHHDPAAFGELRPALSAGGKR